MNPGAIYFCSGLRCSRASSCHRYTKNLATWVKSRGIDPKTLVVHVKQYADSDGKCAGYYTPHRPENYPMDIEYKK